MRLFLHLGRSPITTRPLFLFSIFWVGHPLQFDQFSMFFYLGRSPVKIDQCECVSRLPKIIRSFSFLLFSLQAYYAKSLLRKHCKEGGNCHNPFLGSSKLHFLFLKKKNVENTETVPFERHCSPSSLRMQRQGRR